MNEQLWYDLAVEFLRLAKEDSRRRNEEWALMQEEVKVRVAALAKLQDLGAFGSGQVIDLTDLLKPQDGDDEDHSS